MGAGYALTFPHTDTWHQYLQTSWPFHRNFQCLFLPRVFYRGSPELFQDSVLTSKWGLWRGLAEVLRAIPRCFKLVYPDGGSCWIPARCLEDMNRFGMIGDLIEFPGRGASPVSQGKHSSKHTHGLHTSTRGQRQAKRGAIM